MDKEVAGSSGRPTRAKRVDYKLLAKTKIIEPPPSRKNKKNIIYFVPPKEEARDDDQDSDTTKSAEEERPHNDPMSDHSDIEIEPLRLRNYDGSDIEESPLDHNYAIPARQSRADREPQVKLENVEVAEEEQPLEREPQEPRGQKRHKPATVPKVPKVKKKDLEEDNAEEEEEESTDQEEEQQEEGQVPSVGQGTCINCDLLFKPKNRGKKGSNSRGFYRFSADRVLPNSFCGITGLEEIELLTGRTFPANSEVFKGRFLCPRCWTLLNAIARHRTTCKMFFERTAKTSVLSTKRWRSSSPPGSSKRQRVGGKEDGFDSGMADMLSNFRNSSRPEVVERDVVVKALREQVERLKKKLEEVQQSAKPKFKRYRFPVTHKSTKWEAIVTAVKNRQYRRAIKNMYSATGATKRHFISVAKWIVRKEIRTLLKVADFPLKREISSSQIQWLSWDKTLTQAAESAPLLIGVMKGAVTKQASEKILSRGPLFNMKPKLGVALAVLLNCKSPMGCRFLQQLLSVQMFLGNLQKGTMKMLSHLGLCCSYDYTQNILERVKSESGASTLNLKEDGQNGLISTAPTHNERDEIISKLLSVLSSSEPGIEKELEDQGSKKGGKKKKTKKAKVVPEIIRRSTRKRKIIALEETVGETVGEEAEQECGLDMEVEEAKDEEEEEGMNDEPKEKEEDEGNEDEESEGEEEKGNEEEEEQNEEGEEEAKDEDEGEGGEDEDEDEEEDEETKGELDEEEEEEMDDEEEEEEEEEEGENEAGKDEDEEEEMDDEEEEGVDEEEGENEAGKDEDEEEEEEEDMEEEDEETEEGEGGEETDKVEEEIQEVDENDLRAYDWIFNTIEQS